MFLSLGGKPGQEPPKVQHRGDSFARGMVPIVAIRNGKYYLACGGSAQPITSCQVQVEAGCRRTGRRLAIAKAINVGVLAFGGAKRAATALCVLDERCFEPCGPQSSGPTLKHPVGPLIPFTIM